MAAAGEYALSMEVSVADARGLGATDIATKLGIARACVYRALKDESVPAV